MDCIAVCLQAWEEALLYFAGRGSVTMVKVMLDEYGVDKNALVSPGICLDCEPPRVVEACGKQHGIGSETALMAACLAGHLSVVELLCDRGADVNARNEVRWRRGVALTIALVVRTWRVWHGVVRCWLCSAVDPRFIVRRATSMRML
jgi:hypothetical protein